MSSEEMPAIGSICWTEIPVTSVSRAKKFYGDVFAWEFRNPRAEANCPDADSKEPETLLWSSGPSHGGLCLFKEDDVVSAAKLAGERGKKTAVRVYITVENVDMALEKAQKAGGKLWGEKHEIPNDGGKIAFFVDTEQNVMGVWARH